MYYICREASIYIEDKQHVTLGDPSHKKQIRLYVHDDRFLCIVREAPLAYKDVDLVVDTVHKAGVARKVARLRPMAVVKG
ncbi:MAG TPA: RtcB family protein [Saprospiraceae bacterium]|nr:RtcB family protein [Saprospiraceae bacterium]